MLSMLKLLKRVAKDGIYLEIDEISAAEYAIVVQLVPGLRHHWQPKEKCFDCPLPVHDILILFLIK